MTQTSTVTIVTFLVYIAGVFVLAAFSHRLLSKKSFMSEYFLGSRGLGSWALAFSFAATSASGGSFTGYPSLIYSYGWVLAFWIASYMVVPICTMGVMGKRINQIARKTGAITIPDVLRDRFESTALGLFATCTIIFFTTCNLVAQFKAGALIIEETFNLPETWGYLGGLVIFAGTVVFYTAYGGFRAVVWTDVMQGVIMGIGVVILVPVVLSQSGGLKVVNDAIRSQPPTLVTSISGAYNDLAVKSIGDAGPVGLIYRYRDEPNVPLQVQWPFAEGDQSYVLVDLATGPDGQLAGLSGEGTARATTNTANDVKRLLEEHPQLDSLLDVEIAFENQKMVIADFAASDSEIAQLNEGRPAASLLDALARQGHAVSAELRVTPQASAGQWIVADQRGEHRLRKHASQLRLLYNQGATGWLNVRRGMTKYVFIDGDDVIFGPGRHADGSPFHPLGMAISFFFMWAISGMGQPGTMVRLMAFKESRTLKRAILTVTVYFSLIYLPLVFIFVAARTLLPHIPQESSDKAMVFVATRVVSEMGIGYQVLAAIFVAAPFAAVMSTVDSFLLMISSSIVRDIYQRTVNPNVTEKVVKWASYGTTALVGALVTIVAVKPPDFLQYIIVFTGGGFASTFLSPMLLSIYWKGMTRQGALAAMIGGFVIIVSLFTMGFVLNYLGVDIPPARINLFGFHPVFWGLSGSLLLAVTVSKLTGPAPAHLVRRYFYK